MVDVVVNKEFKAQTKIILRLFQHVGIAVDYLYQQTVFSLIIWHKLYFHFIKTGFGKDIKAYFMTLIRIRKNLLDF